MRGTLEVHRYLVERAIPHEFYRLDRPLRRIADAPALLELDPLIVVAAELFEASESNVLALTSVTMCASGAAVASAIEVKRVRAATKARTAVHTGFLPDWLPPVGHERPSRALMDVALNDVDVVYAAGGDPGVMLVLRAGDLARAASAVLTPLAASASLAG